MSPVYPPGLGIIYSARYFGIIAMPADAANISDPDHSFSYYHDNKVTRDIFTEINDCAPGSSAIYVHVTY